MRAALRRLELAGHRETEPRGRTFDLGANEAEQQRPVGLARGDQVVGERPDLGLERTGQHCSYAGLALGDQALRSDPGTLTRDIG